MATNRELYDYIVQSARARNIDPEIALRVARGEGGLNDPFRHGEGPAPKSQLASLGSKEHSFGPFQLYISGTGAGLGDRALKAGIDPRKDWKGGIDFALDEVTRKGWGQWYGAKNAGITGMMGVGNNAKALGTTLSSNPMSDASAPVGDVGGLGRGAIMANQQAETDPGVYGNPTTLTTANTGAYPPAPGSTADKAGPATFGEKLKGVLGGDAFKSLAKAAGQREGDKGELTPSSLGAVQAADAGRMQAAQALMATLMAGRKRRGVTLNTPSLEGFMG